MINCGEVESGLDATFAALADPTRRAILSRLALGEASVSDLARPFAMSLPAVLKHLEALERSRLVVTKKEGRVRTCRLEAAPLAGAADWIAGCRRFWEERFDALEQYLHDVGETERRKELEPWQKTRRSPRSRSGSPAGSPPRGSGSSAPSSRRKR